MNKGKAFTLVEFLIAASMFLVVSFLGWQIYNASHVYVGKWLSDWDLEGDMWVISESLRKYMPLCSNVIMLSSHKVCIDYFSSVNSVEQLYVGMCTPGVMTMADNLTNVCSGYQLTNKLNVTESYFALINVPDQSKKILKVKVVLQFGKRKLEQVLTYVLGMSEV